MKTNWLPFTDSTLFYILFLSESKSSFINSSASLLIMISMLSLFESITRSSPLSMEEIKLFPIVNWVFHVSHFLKLFNVFQIWSNFIKISFNWQCFISITTTFVFSIIVTRKISYSYWFIIYFFFFFMLKNIFNIS